MGKQKLSVKGLNKSSTRDTLRRIREYRLPELEYRALVEDFYIALDSPVSLSCYLLWRYGEDKQLAEKDIDPDDYLSADIFRDDFAAVSFMRKNSSLKTGLNLKDIAISSFLQAEEKCKSTNLSLSTKLVTLLNQEGDWWVYNALIRRIERILGQFSIDEVLQRSSWGPGSTTSIRGSDTSASRKFDFECDITLEAYNLFHETLLRAYPSWEKLKLMRIVKGNSIVTVPKNAKTDRTIAIEPGLNTWIQLGIGKSIRAKLRLAGYDLNSDYKNRYGALMGSRDNSLATIDFKAASDTISRQLVENILPPTWFMVLDSARSHTYSLNETIHVSEKFSTMGNGFTFELESLIFLSLALSVCDWLNLDSTSVSIFGDDLVLPSQGVEKLTHMCEVLGFTVNQQKSFSSGNFRESCGSYYFLGNDVKPIFLKDRLFFLKDLNRFANSVRTFSHISDSIGCDTRFRHIWTRTTNLLPNSLRFFGPRSAGDACISSNLDEASTQRHRDHWEGFLFQGIPTVAVSIEKDTLGLLLSRLYSPSFERSFGNNVPLRSKVRIVLKKTMFTSQWYDFGPWITRVKFC